jgi:hypothetical protein
MTILLKNRKNPNPNMTILLENRTSPQKNMTILLKNRKNRPRTTPATTPNPPNLL